MVPAVGSVWRDRHVSKRTVKVIGTLGDHGPVVSNTLTEDDGEPPTRGGTNHTKLSEWDWLYEPVALGAKT